MKTMVWLVLRIGYLAIIFCVMILIRPNLLRRALDFFSVGSRLYLAGFVRLLLGMLLLILAPQARLWGYVTIVGLLAAANGLSLFFLALKRSKKLLKRLQAQNDLRLRLLAIVGLAIWAVLIYSLLPQGLALYPY